MPGLPYLRKLSLDDFEISVILSFRVLKYGNISQKSWKLNTRTFSFQASCAREPKSQWRGLMTTPTISGASAPIRRVRVDEHSNFQFGHLILEDFQRLAYPYRG